jgi:hypothetical protein
MNPIHVHLTDDQIEYGVQQNNARCAGVLAIKAADPEIERVRVTRDTITFSHRGDDMRYTVKTPRAMVRFVDNFDAEDGKLRCRPVSFTLDPSAAITARPRLHEGGPDRMIREATRRPRAAGTVRQSSRRLRLVAGAAE